MPFVFSIPTAVPSEPLEVSLKAGEMLFVLGANGTGKSSLLQHFNAASDPPARRITAHRQTWLRSGSAAVTGAQRLEYGTAVANYDRDSTSRWMDDYSEQRAQMAVYDLIAAENARAREIAHAADANDDGQVRVLAEVGGVFARLNRLLRLSNLDIEISIEASEEIKATRVSGNSYSISKLSDGERNAILIASNVLTVPAGTLLLIDEPERHLHRSIISPLLSLLLQERPDCAFVVSTHEPMLPVDNPAASVILTRGCTYEGDTVVSYDIDMLTGTEVIDDDLKATILGERRKIVFVEGVEHSLDKPLYSLLFPKASVVPKASCRDVEQAVDGIRNAEALHWVQAFGIVDNDTSDAERLTKLAARGVVPISVYSVESVYYHPDVQRLAGEKLAEVVGGDIDQKLADARTSALKALQQQRTHLAACIAEKAARAQVFTLLPKKGEMSSGGKRTADIDFGGCLNAEQNRLDALVGAQDFAGILQRYPIRESGALDAIAKALGYAGRAQYESAVLQLLLKDPQAVERVRALLGPVPQELVA